MAFQNNAAADERARPKALSRSALTGIWALLLAVLLALAALTISWSAPAAAEGLPEGGATEVHEQPPHNQRALQIQPYAPSRVAERDQAAQQAVTPLRRSWTPAPGRAGTLALIHGLRTQRAGPQ